MNTQELLSDGILQHQQDAKNQHAQREYFLSLLAIALPALRDAMTGGNVRAAIACNQIARIPKP